MLWKCREDLLFRADSLRDDHLHPAGQTIGPESWLVCLPAYLPNSHGRPRNGSRCTTEGDASFGVRTTMNHYGLCMRNQTPDQRVDAGKLLPESMKAASRAIQ